MFLYHQSMRREVCGEKIRQRIEWPRAEEVSEEVKSSLKKVERCRELVKYKAWMLQHLILSREMWSLIIYNIPWINVEVTHSDITQVLKRWQGQLKSLSVDVCIPKPASQILYTQNWQRKWNDPSQVFLQPWNKQKTQEWEAKVWEKQTLKEASKLQNPLPPLPSSTPFLSLSFRKTGLFLHHQGS